MFYVSPALTTLMLALVPPVSLGVVRRLARHFALRLTSARFSTAVTLRNCQTKRRKPSVK